MVTITKTTVAVLATLMLILSVITTAQQYEHTSKQELYNFLQNMLIFFDFFFFFLHLKSTLKLFIGDDDKSIFNRHSVKPTIRAAR